MKYSIYGNKQLLSSLENMIKMNRAASTVLFYGEKGSGRKMFADYYCRLLLCEDLKNGKPCGECRACRNLNSKVHPDVIFPEKSGKLGGYSVSTAKSVCSDAYVKPNNSDKKIYIFSDCHAMDVRTQNTLLKIIEEPPEHVHFIFTSESKNDFLPTIISRCSSFAVSECSEDECSSALKEREYTDEQIKTAIKCFHGNIGRCIDYLEDENLHNSVELTKSLVNSIISKDEYSLMLSLTSLGSDRKSIKTALTLLDKQIRDSAALLSGNNDKTGCYPEGAYRLADILTVSQAIKMHNAVSKAWAGIESNASALLVLMALCAEISAA